MENKKSLQEIAQEKGKQLLVENFSISSTSVNLSDLSKTEKLPIVESKKGKQYEAIGIVRDVPVTKFTENLNGRIYPKRLWENVYKSKMAEGTLCLADHPADNSEGSVKDIVGVWRNFKLNESNCTGDLYLIGKHGKQFLEVLKAGGKCGLSSVGFGELMEDEKTVDPSTYELVRLSDWVLTPSQGVFAEQDHLKESLKESKSNTNIIRNNTMSSSIQALTVRNNVKIALKESEKAIESKGSSLVSAKKELQEVLQYIPEEYKEERKKLKDQISLVEKTLQQTLQDKSKRLQESVKTSSDLKVKYEASNAILSRLKEKHTKASQVIKLLSENESIMKKDIQHLMKERGLMYNDLKAFKEDYKKMGSDIVNLVSERGIILSDLRNSMQEKVDMVEDIKALLEDKKLMKKDISSLLEDRKTMQKDIERLVKENLKLKKKYSESGEYEALEMPDVEEPETVQADEYAGEEYEAVVDPAIAYRSDDEDFGGVPFTNYNASYEGEMIGERKKTFRKPIKESFHSFKPNNDVVKYFESKVKQKPVLKAIKEQVYSQKSLVQAVKLVEKFLSADIDKPIKLSEAFKQNTWIGDREI